MNQSSAVYPKPKAGDQTDKLEALVQKVLEKVAKDEAANKTWQAAWKDIKNV